MVGGIASAVLTEVVLHRIRHRLDRGQEKADALANLEMAVGHVEDEWQTSGGRPTPRQTEERKRRLEELRDALTESRVVLGRPRHGLLATCHTRMAESAQGARAAEVRLAARDALAILDDAGRRGIRHRWSKRKGADQMEP